MIGGYFNAQHNLWNRKSEYTNGKKITNWFQSYGDYYNISIFASKHPTCNRSFGGSHINLGFITTKSLSKTLMQSEPYSDHAALILKLSIEPEIAETRTIKNYRKSDWTKIRRNKGIELNTIQIQTMRNATMDEIETLIEKMMSIYNDTIEKYTPDLKIKRNELKLSNQIQRLLKEKKTLLRKKFRN